MTLRLCRLWWIPALCLAFGPLALAAAGELKGKALDRSGTPLPGVTVVVRNDALDIVLQPAAELKETVRVEVKSSIC